MNASRSGHPARHRARRSTLPALLVSVLLLAASGAAFRVHAEATVPAHPEAPQPAPRLWSCGMHPQVVRDRPGECPICHMELTPLDAATTGQPSTRATVTIDPTVVQNMGLRTATVVEGPLHRQVRATGFVVEAEPGIHDVSLRVSGWIEKLHADTEGVHVQAGDPLFDLYSPDLQVAVDELLAVSKSLAASPRDASLAALHAAAQRRLSLYGLDDREIARLSAMPRAPRTVTFRSPVTGHVTDKPFVAGSAVRSGDRVLRIVDHTTVWIDARIFEQDLAMVSVGQKVEASIAGRPGEVVEGEVIFVHPHVDETTRSASVRLAVANPDLGLRPGMFAEVSLHAQLAARAVLAPRDAVIDTGRRQVVFLAGAEPGHFEARDVRVGHAADGGAVQILEGLVPGDEVVVSGQFLLDSESRLQEALRRFLAPTGTRDGAGHVPGAHQH